VLRHGWWSRASCVCPISGVAGKLAVKPAGPTAALRWLVRLPPEKAARLPLRVLRLASEAPEVGVSNTLASGFVSVGQKSPGRQALPASCKVDCTGPSLMWRSGVDATPERDQRPRDTAANICESAEDSRDDEPASSASSSELLLGSKAWEVRGSRRVRKKPRLPRPCSFACLASPATSPQGAWLDVFAAAACLSVGRRAAPAAAIGKAGALRDDERPGCGRFGIGSTRTRADAKCSRSS